MRSRTAAGIHGHLGDVISHATLSRRRWAFNFAIWRWGTTMRWILTRWLLSDRLFPFVRGQTQVLSHLQFAIASMLHENLQQLSFLPPLEDVNPAACRKECPSFILEPFFNLLISFTTVVFEALGLRQGVVLHRHLILVVFRVVLALALFWLGFGRAVVLIVPRFGLQ